MTLKPRRAQAWAVCLCVCESVDGILVKEISLLLSRMTRAVICGKGWGPLGGGNKKYAVAQKGLRAPDPEARSRQAGFVFC